MYLDELIKELGITEEIDKAVLAAIVVTTIKDNKLARDVGTEDLKHAVIDGVVSEYMFDVCNLAASWCNDLTDLFCKRIGYKEPRKFFSNTIWPYLRRKTPMDGVQLMP